MPSVVTTTLAEGLLAHSESGIPIGNDLMATPFGNQDWGSSSTGSFNGGGNAQGLYKGQSGTWVFSVSGTAAALAAVSSPAVFNNVLNIWDFVVRIKGITSGGASVSEKLTSTFAVPSPGVAALVGLAVLATRRRR